MHGWLWHCLLPWWAGGVVAPKWQGSVKLFLVEGVVLSDLWNGLKYLIKTFVFFADNAVQVHVADGIVPFVKFDMTGWGVKLQQLNFQENGLDRIKASLLCFPGKGSRT